MLDQENVEFSQLQGAGKGALGVTIVKGIPFLEDDSFCRFRCLCYDGGCLKFAPIVQYYCFKFDGGFKLVTGMPLTEDLDNFCRFRCLCYDGGCRNFEVPFVRVFLRALLPSFPTR